MTKVGTFQGEGTEAKGPNTFPVLLAPGLGAWREHFLKVPPNHEHFSPLKTFSY